MLSTIATMGNFLQLDVHLKLIHLIKTKWVLFISFALLPTVLSVPFLMSARPLRLLQPILPTLLVAVPQLMEHRFQLVRKIHSMIH